LKVQITGTIVVAGRDTRSGRIIIHTGRSANLVKCAVSVVLIEPIGRIDVDQIQIQIAVVVVIAPGVALPGIGIIHRQSTGYIRKCAVPVIAIQSDLRCRPSVDYNRDPVTIVIIIREVCFLYS